MGQRTEPRIAKAVSWEESHELLGALDEGYSAQIREELGDLLHQIIFHCQIAAESGALARKM